MTGQTVSHYRILEKLGEGGMGVVYKAEDTKLKRTVALKFLPAHAVGEGEHRARFEREAQAAAALNHPNICTVYEIDENNGVPFIAMEFVDGETLAAVIEKGPLKIDEALDIAIQAARGLAEAHGRGIVHRDIKSANIMVAPERTGQERQVKLMDFGLAQLATARTQLTKEGSTLGTMAYMAPEQARGEKVDHRADIWALGVVLYEMVAGRLPYRADYEQAVFYSILNETHEPLTAVRTGVPKELERIVDKALAKDTGPRYQHAEDMLVDTRELKRQRESESSTRPAPTATAARPMSNWYALGGAAAVAALAVVLWTIRSGTPPAPAADETLRPVPFTSYEGIETFATFSPDGNQVAFAWNGESGEQFDIYAKGVGTGQPLRLTTDPADDLAPSWSPDGRWIAFRRSAREGSAVYLVPPLGGAERKVATLTAWKSDQIAWSPDAKILFFSDRNGVSGVWSIVALEIETGETQGFSSPPPTTHGDGSPAVSPETGSVAFARASAGAFEGIYLRPASGEAERQVLAPGSRVVEGLTWTGTEELLFADREGTIWRVPMKAPSPRAAPGVASGARRPVASQISRRLVYEAWQSDQNIWRYGLSTGSEAQAAVKIVASTQIEHSPQISPDGQRVVFVSTRTGRSEIWASDVSGSNATQLTGLAGQGGVQGQSVGSPRWSRDGRKIAFDATVQGSWDIYTLEVQGGSPKPLVVADGEDSRPSWSHEGKWVYFGTNRSGRFEVWKAPTGGGAPVQVTVNGGYHPMESPDGRFLYYTKRLEPGIWRIPAAGGEETLVVSEVGLGTAGAFDPSNDGVYYLEPVDETAGRTWRLKFHDVNSGQSRVVARMPAAPAVGATPLDVAPDGTWFAYAQQDESGSDLMLVENFR